MSDDFFGPPPEGLKFIADEAKRRFDEASIVYGEALVALANAITIHAGPIGDAVSSLEKALAIYSLAGVDSQCIAGVHHRLASMLRRSGKHEHAADHLAKAIAIWESSETVDEHLLARYREELEELEMIIRNACTPPPG